MLFLLNTIVSFTILLLLQNNRIVFWDNIIFQKKKSESVGLKSQNCRTVEVGWDLWRSFCPTPLFKQPRVAQDHDLTNLSMSREGDSLTSLGKLCQCSIIITVKRGVLMFRGNLLCLRACLWPLVLSLGTTEKKPGSILFSPTLQVPVPICKTKTFKPPPKHTKTPEVTCQLDLDNSLSKNSDISMFYQVREVGFVKGHHGILRLPCP